MSRVNVEVVQAAEREGWTLWWIELPQLLLDEDDWKSEPGSDSDEPIYGVCAVVEGDLCTLWRSSSDGRIMRSATRKEYEADLH